MTDLVDNIKNSLSSGSFATRCSRKGCSVKLSDAPTPYCLIDMDTGVVDENDSKCDYIFVGGASDVWVVPIELKRGAFKVGEVVKQLQSGARLAEKICKGFQVRFRPVVASGAVNRKIPRRELRNKFSSVRFRGSNVNFERIRCGQSLISALK